MQMYFVGYTSRRKWHWSDCEFFRSLTNPRNVLWDRYATSIVVFDLNIIYSSHNLVKSFYREALVWQGLNHAHILPFLGISEQVFGSSLCMVSPWLANGNALQHRTYLIDHQKLCGKAYLDTIHRWVRESRYILISVANHPIVTVFGNRTWSSISTWNRHHTRRCSRGEFCHIISSQFLIRP